MSPSERRKRMAELINRTGECAVEMLMDQFGVSDMTIRRDLQTLADAGKVIRTHGGAAPAERLAFELNYLNRSLAMNAEKQAIGRRAAALIRPGSSIILGVGTTALEIAKALKGMTGITVITTSFPVVSELQFCDGLQVMLLGGFIRRGSPDLTGTLTEGNLENLYCDQAFLGVDAIDDRGNVYDQDISLARLLTKMVAAAKEVYAVADHSKMARKALVRYSCLTGWKALITDRGLAAESRKSLEQLGVKIIFA